MMKDLAEALCGSRDASFEEMMERVTELKRAEKKSNGIWKRPDWIDMEAWSDFEQHRSEIRKPLSNLARNKAANLLKGLTPQQQRACVDKSIQARWSGLFPDSVRQREAHQPVSRAKRVSDELDRIAAQDIAENGFTETLD
jgi:hypothetical protein